MTLTLPNDNKRAQAPEISPQTSWHGLHLSALTVALGLVVFRTYAFFTNLDAAPLDRFILPALVAVLAGELFFNASPRHRVDQNPGAANGSGNGDAIAGCYSGAELTSMIEREVSRAGRAGRPLAILMIDITSAGVDSAAPARSDKLQQLTQTIRGATRNSDVLGRMDPGELALILADTPAENAAIVIDKLRRILAEADPGRLNVKLVTARQDGDSKGIIWRYGDPV
jgi:diguanylate cyclase (GGDEF)-like protein